MTIPPFSSRDIEIKWAPQAAGIQRELLLLALDERHTVQAILYGMARESRVEKVWIIRQSYSSCPLTLMEPLHSFVLGQESFAPFFLLILVRDAYIYIYIY